MKALSLKLPDALFIKIEHETHVKGISKSDLLRELLLRYFSEKMQQKTVSGSFLDFAEDLCGIEKGPADLSSHKKHLKGYGE